MLYTGYSGKESSYAYALDDGATIVFPQPQLTLFANAVRAYGEGRMVSCGNGVTISTDKGMHWNDMRGQAVATLLDERREAGEQNIAFDARELPAGAYVCRLSASGAEAHMTIVVAH